MSRLVELAKRHPGTTIVLGACANVVALLAWVAYLEFLR